jgi:DNA-binding NarL/FixJ family response regulator
MLSATEAQDARPTERTPIRVVLVDDHPVLRAGLSSLLNAEADIEVVAEAATGSSAVEVAARVEPDLVIMDLSLPNMSGTEATRQILARDPRIKVLALTAHEDVSFARALLEAGALGYALKRSVCDELLRAVRVVAAGSKYVDPSLRGLLPASAGERSAGSVAEPVPVLSEREAEVVRLIAEGHTSKDMARQLGLSPRTLETYKARAMSKLNVRTRAGLIRHAIRCGWLRDT